MYDICGMKNLRMEINAPTTVIAFSPWVNVLIWKDSTQAYRPTHSFLDRSWVCTAFRHWSIAPEAHTISLTKL